MSDYSRTYQSREADYKEIEKAMSSGDAQVRRNAEEAARRISSESGSVRSMREALIREHRAGNMENVKDIQMEVEKHRHLQNK